MSIEEQQEIKSNAYSEAMRYMENAKATLQKAGKEDDQYHDVKYVRTACGTAYNGILLALDAYLQLKDVEMPKKKRRSIEFYTSHVAQIDKKLLVCVNRAYDTLHLWGYYDGTDDAVVIKRGFDYAYQIIDKIKPDHVQKLPPPPKPSPLKRIYTFIYLTCFIPCWYFFKIFKSVRLTFHQS
ncbi:MAG: DUF5618 family protein [Prevotellaceae bacterium]|jgi:hypothetical protein|nr:DUF5618 family protein [Prevotellaceae bacterium]